MMSRQIAVYLVLVVSPLAVSAEEAVQFNRDIRPILADKCLACHGPDKNKREAELRLDTGEGAFEKREGKTTLVPGQPDESELIRRITSSDEDERMPPASTQKTITPQQVDLLRRWIAQGAKFEPHWALIASTRVVPPDAGKGWAYNEIDRFVAAGHASHNLVPSPDSDRRTLARRLNFDLLGLPPAPQEVDAFVADTSEKAYETLVDRLLTSPHFGERLAMYWLDVVRYADSGGYHSDNERELAPYRDYVIAAFNENLPFDQFTIEQIAGDLLPGATTRQKIASGYNRLLQTTEEGGAQPKEYSAKYQSDRVRNTSVAWLAMTMGCCECHTHKFDPLTIRDFYSFAAFFADVQEKPVGRQDQTALPTPEQEAELAKLDEQSRPLQETYNRDTPELAASQAKWEEQYKADMAAGKSIWSIAKPEKIESTGGSTLTTQEDQSVLASGKNPDKDTYVINLRNGSTATTALRLETLTHESLVNKSLSRANGNFVLTEVQVTAQPAGSDKPQPVKFSAAEADFSQENHPIALAIDGKADTGWAVAGHEKAVDHRALFVFEKPIAADAAVVVKLSHSSQFEKHNIGRFRIALTSAEKPGLSDDGLSAEIQAALAVPADQRTTEQRASVVKYYRTIAPELADVRSQLAGIEKRKQEIQQAFPKSLVSMSVAPRTVRILPRGNWLDESGEIVQPATPEALPPAAKYDDRQQARLALARWFVRRDQPLTARVFVNRLWKLMFGQGIVKTLDDFGIQGSAPTHPELLDWLAVEFMDSGWNVKHMVKLMVMSRAYQQSSNASPKLRDRDPANLWLARQSAFRLDAEFVRDNALSISGLLSHKIGGKSVKPYQPAGYWRYLNFPTREWQNDRGEDLYRRGMYTHWQRTFLQPSLLAFDAPSREECTVERPRSNTPLQALVLLNDPTYVEAARVFATRVMEQSAPAGDRLTFAFRQALQRTPTAQESEVLTALWQKHRDEYSKEPANAEAVLKVGEWPVPANVDKVELAAWTSVCRTILNLHETITRQ
jgi:mono/diheme cytochrome c family protein